MQNIIRISEAAVIALHAAQHIAADGGRRRSAAELAAALGVSHNHLSKVMQRLTRAWLVSPARGPGGGFTLTARAGSATLRDIVEAIEGPLVFSGCLMAGRGCGKKDCGFGRLLTETNRKFEKVLSQKVLSRDTRAHDSASVKRR